MALRDPSSIEKTSASEKMSCICMGMLWSILYELPTEQLSVFAVSTSTIQLVWSYQTLAADDRSRYRALLADQGKYGLRSSAWVKHCFTVSLWASRVQGFFECAFP
eukprot:3973812-Amphidinium_carterae.1